MSRTLILVVRLFICLTLAVVISGCSLRSRAEGVPSEGVDDIRRACIAAAEKQEGTEEWAADMDGCCTKCTMRVEQASTLAREHFSHTRDVRLVVVFGGAVLAWLLAFGAHRYLQRRGQRLGKVTLWVVALLSVLAGSAIAVGAGLFQEGTKTLAGLREADIIIRQLHAQGALESGARMGAGCVRPVELSASAPRRQCAGKVAEHVGFANQALEKIGDKRPEDARYKKAVEERARDLVDLLKLDRVYNRTDDTPDAVGLDEWTIYQHNVYIGKAASARLWLLSGWIVPGWVWAWFGSFLLGVLLWWGTTILAKRF